MCSTYSTANVQYIQYSKCAVHTVLHALYACDKAKVYGWELVSLQVGLHDLKHFVEVKRVRFFDRYIDIRGMYMCMVAQW